MATKKQVLRNEIRVKETGYVITFFVNEKVVGSFEFSDLKHLVCFRELIANLPSLKNKLQLFLENDALAWFEEKIREIDRRARNEKTKKAKDKKEDFDLDSYLSSFGL